MTAKPSDLDALQGVWRITTMEMDGRAMAPAMFADASITIDGERFTSVGMGFTYKGRIALDTKVKPRRLDLHFESGPPAGTSNPCIYALEGDRLTLCVSMQSGKPPKAFGAPAGSGFALQRLTRAATKAKTRRAAPPSATAASPPETKGQGPVTPLEGEWRMVGGSVAGVKMDPETMRWVRRVTSGDRTSVYAGPQVIMQFRFSIDGTSIDYVHTAGAHRGATQLGIFAIDGGRLTVRMAAPGAARPRRLDGPTGTRDTLTVWERA